MKPESPEDQAVTPSEPKAGGYYVIITDRKTITGCRWFVIRYLRPVLGFSAFWAVLLAYRSKGKIIQSFNKNEYNFDNEYTFLPITKEQAESTDFLNWIALCYG